MKILLKTIIILLWCQICQAQKISILPSGEVDLIESLLNIKPENFGIEANSKITLSCEVDLSKVFKIEGLTTKYVGKSKINFKVVNNYGDLDTTFSYTIETSAPSKSEVFSKTKSSFIKDKVLQTKMNNEIHSYLLAKANHNCKTELEEAKQNFINKEWKEAYQKASAQLLTTCNKDAKALMTKIDMAYDEEFCNEKLTKIKIMANSGIEYRMEIALEELLTIPKNSKCKEEALKISKQIGDYLLKKGEINSS
ncbi:MAG: hypothetical protein ACOVQ4_01180, partial [Flectobacillus sp.]|uniref:hypothetical protein n=1 Tax=Flectobacillus sp. TaxID=50419 RepID=UPI003B9C88F8